jgi:dihydroorotase-like cyclic amidohydrolase
VNSAITNKPVAVRSDRIFTDGGWIDDTIAASDGRMVDVTSAPVKAVEQIDAVGRVVLPGLVETHAHFRDSGFTGKEDFETGTRSAVAGGVTTVFDGSAEVIATDHSPHTKEEREIGWTNTCACPGGSPKIQHRTATISHYKSGWTPFEGRQVTGAMKTSLTERVS